MLIAITLHLQLHDSVEHPVVLPAHLGRANYAATLARLNQVDPALGALVHDGDGPKAVTCSSILNGRPTKEGLAVQPATTYFVRITGLDPRVSAGLQAGLLVDRPTTWELDGRSFQVLDAVCQADRDPWSGTITYEELAARQLTAPGRAAKRTTLHFAAPTAFKSAGKTIPIPLPGLVFGSLVERWNSFSPVTLSPEMRRFGEEMVAISRYRLESRPVAQKQGALRMGGVGQVTYVALGGDRYWHGVMQMLADFALFSGVGVQTATGMGQCRRTDRADRHESPPGN